MWRFLVYLMILSLVVLPIETVAENPFKNAKDFRYELKLEFGKPKGKVYEDIAVVFEKSGDFQDIVDGLNRTFIFPKTVTIKFAMGDGPYYSPGNNTVYMSYDFIYYLSSLYLKQYPKASDDAMIDFSLRSTEFLMYHELAHALIDLYQLPIVSNEESAADNLAVILALEYTRDGLDTVLDSAVLFDLLDKDAPKYYEESDYWDEHALDAQRFYNILCLAYGRYPTAVKREITDVKNQKLIMFIKERGDWCIYQYETQLKAWGKLLNDYIK